MEITTTISMFYQVIVNAPQMIDGDAVAVIEDILPILNLFDATAKDC